MAQPQTPAFMTVAEVASMMRVSKMTVYRLVIGATATRLHLAPETR